MYPKFLFSEIHIEKFLFVFSIIVLHKFSGVYNRKV